MSEHIFQRVNAGERVILTSRRDGKPSMFANPSGRYFCSNGTILQQNDAGELAEVPDSELSEEERRWCAEERARDAKRQAPDGWLKGVLGVPAE